MDQCISYIIPMQRNVKLSCDNGSKEVNGTMYIDLEIMEH
jgi:hypothetical protein